MKIDDRNAANLNPAALDQARLAEAAEAQRASRAGLPNQQDGSDRVALSELSARLQELAGGGDAREARIQALAAEFEAGRYEPDLDAVADALIAEAELKEEGGGEL
ncbi:MAG: flagellar biosynthesis anti-sigma factor FlgM [Bryobacteraceae bacterium]|jgi:flagellar biosynthesis anti-sigma factor FlgM